MIWGIKEIGGVAEGHRSATCDQPSNHRFQDSGGTSPCLTDYHRVGLLLPYILNKRLFSLQMGNV